MNKPIKLPEIRKEVFTKARESLGLSTKDLSGMSCLSVRQIEQIENGENSSFYGDQVKLTAAKKVAGLLKLKPEEAFDFGEVMQSAKVTDMTGSGIGETSTTVLEKKVNSEKAEVNKEAPSVTTASEPKSEKTSARKIRASVLNNSAKSKPAPDPKKKLFLMLAIAAAVIFSVVNLRPLFFPEPIKEEVIIIQEVAQETPPANVPAEPVTESKPAPVVAVQPESAAISTECPPADTAPLNYKPDLAKKAGDMVYLQSKTAQMVCVVDATGKSQNKMLEPGSGVSVFGKPPLKVLTNGLNQVDLYFQGAKVRIGNTGNKTIILEPAEIIQPPAPSTSTDSQLR